MLSIITYREEYKVPSGIEGRIQLGKSSYISTMTNGVDGFVTETKSNIRFSNWLDKGILIIEDDGQISFRSEDYSDEFINEFIFIDKIIREKLVELKNRDKFLPDGMDKYNWNDAMHEALSDISYIRNKRLELILD